MRAMMHTQTREKQENFFSAQKTAQIKTTNSRPRNVKFLSAQKRREKKFFPRRAGNGKILISARKTVRKKLKRKRGGWKRVKFYKTSLTLAKVENKSIKCLEITAS